MSLTQPHFKPVYILGAGASNRIGAPLLDDFLTRARELRYSPGFPDELKKMFDQVFDYHGELSRTKYFLGTDLGNLEILFSMLDMDRETESRNENTKRYLYLTYVRECLITLIIETLKQSTKSSGQDAWVGYKVLIQFLAAFPASTFITFNYDLAIEEALRNPSLKGAAQTLTVKYGTSNSDLPMSEKERLVLKLHGSADWTYCPKCKALSPLEGYVLPSELVGKRHLIHDEGNCKNVEGFLNVIIPPTWQKLNYVEGITNVWRQSIKEISSATHLFIIGYSFPRTDVFFDQLLALGLQNSQNLKRVVVINPSSDVKETLSDFFERHFLRRTVLFLSDKFEGLHVFIKDPISSEENMKSVGKHMEDVVRSRERSN